VKTFGRQNCPFFLIINQLEGFDNMASNLLCLTDGTANLRSVPRSDSFSDKEAMSQNIGFGDPVNIIYKEGGHMIAILRRVHRRLVILARLSLPFLILTFLMDASVVGGFQGAVYAQATTTLQFYSTTYNAKESVSNAVIKVVRSGSLAGTVTLDYATSDGTATAGTDYLSRSGSLSFGPNVSSKTFSVPMLNDTIAEGPETINLLLSNPTGGAILGNQSTSVLTITDDDPVSKYGLFVTVQGEGAGAVTSSPLGINCGTDCSQKYVEGTTVTLNAKPSATSTFTGWEGACSGPDACTVTLDADTSVAATFTLGRYHFPIRGLWVQFERRGWASGYWSGEVIQEFNNFDAVIGRTVSEEVALQLDEMRAMGINTITFELRTADPTSGEFTPPECNMSPVLGLQWPQPTTTELTNLASFFALVHSKDMKVILVLTNNHMEEQPPLNSETWLGPILNTVKDHPALEFILFNGNEHMIDTDGNGTPDSCGPPAEPPLWLGANSAPATYVKWAIGYGLSLGLPARQLSAEAVVGDYFVDSQPPAGPSATDGHLWKPIVVLKGIFDALGIPNNQRTYALSFYQHRKCATARGLDCTDMIPHAWAEKTLQSVYSVIGTRSGARVVAGEMGNLTPVDPDWKTEQALESLVFLMGKYKAQGGSFWRWTSFSNDEDADPQLADPVKQRGIGFNYNRVQKEVLDMGGFHLPKIPNASFESGTASPSSWTISGTGQGRRYLLTGEAGQPEVPSRGKYALRLTTESGENDEVRALSQMITVASETSYTTTANLRFNWSGDPNPGGDPQTRPQIFVSIHYFDSAGLPSTVRTNDTFRYFQEDNTSGFGTFPMKYTTPGDTHFVQVEIGVARNGLPTPITLDVDNLR
jgi:hypothetical protein